jgi:hypothetical protein
MQNAECGIQKVPKERVAQIERTRGWSFGFFLDSSFCILHSAFEHVPSPSADDAAAGATLLVTGGRLDSNKVYGSRGTGRSFEAAPKSTLDPEALGWKLIAFVDTRDPGGGGGGQYGVRIADEGGILGTWRYLLFDVFETESDDAWGQTFYSEIDVIR